MTNMTLTSTLCTAPRPPCSMTRSRQPANSNTEMISIFIRIPLYNRRFIDRTFTKFFQSETFTLDIDSVEAPLRDGFIMNVAL